MYGALLHNRPWQYGIWLKWPITRGFLNHHYRRVRCGFTARTVYKNHVRWVQVLRTVGTQKICAMILTNA
jgi:hypothetical protein